MLADWLTSGDNPFFAKSVVNRIWFHLNGKGIVDPVDDFRDSNPSANDELLDALAKDFAAQQVRRQAPDPRHHELADLSAQRPGQRVQQGRQQVFLARGDEAADGRAAARRHLHRDGSAGEVRRSAAGHASGAAARRRRAIIRSSRRSASRPASWPASASARATATSPRRCSSSTARRSTRSCATPTTASAGCSRRRRRSWRSSTSCTCPRCRVRRRPMTSRCRWSTSARRRTSARRGKTCTGHCSTPRSSCSGIDPILV